MPSYRRKVQRVVDGDTYKVRNNVRGSQYIRISGMNCPEKGQRGYQTAKNNLARKIQGKNVTIRPKAKSYGRTVADVVHNRRRLRGC